MIQGLRSVRGLGLSWRWLRRPTAGGLWSHSRLCLGPAAAGTPAGFCPSFPSQRKRTTPPTPRNPPPWETPYQKSQRLGAAFSHPIYQTIPHHILKTHSFPINTPIPSSYCLLLRFLSPAPIPLASTFWTFQMSLLDLKALLSSCP